MTTETPIEGADTAYPTYADISEAASSHEFWLRHVRTGVYLSAGALLLVSGYLLLTPDEPDRPALWVLVAGVSVMTGAVLALPWRRLLSRGRAMVVLYAWSGASTAFIAAGVALDGGLRSPLSLLLLLPLTFGAMVFPPRAVTALGLTVAAAQVVAAALADTLAAPELLLSTGAIALIAYTCSRVAGTHALAQQGLQRLAARLERLAHVDGLTGCLNHSALQERLAEELARASRSGEQVSLLLLDLDQFKAINDAHGHLAGDQVLASVGAAMREQLREGDVVGRVGGEEFAVVLPDTGVDEALLVAERIRHCIAEVATSTPVTASIGLSVSVGGRLGGQELYGRADSGLYAAKRSGRNRVVLDTELDWQPVSEGEADGFEPDPITPTHGG